MNIYRKIFPKVVFDDFEDYATSAIKTLIGLFTALLIVAVVIAANLGEKKEQIKEANRRINQLEEINKRYQSSFEMMNRRIEALEKKGKGR